MKQTELEDILDSLKFSYVQYKSAISKNNHIDIAYTQGFCNAFEEIIEVYCEVPRNNIEDIRKDFLGEIALVRRNPLDFIEIVET